VPVHAQTGAALEYQVKAAFILNFISFTEWPPAALGNDGTPFRLCVAGDNPFGGSLEGTVGGEKVAGHMIQVERLSAAGEIRRCGALFVGRSSRQESELLRAAQSAPILTVGESSGFLDGGGIINFIVESGHVRFDINRQAAEQRGLKLSSRLLRLARTVT